MFFLNCSIIADTCLIFLSTDIVRFTNVCYKHYFYTIKSKKVDNCYLSVIYTLNNTIACFENSYMIMQ